VSVDRLFLTAEVARAKVGGAPLSVIKRCVEAQKDR
jgi:hypothetical protein